MSAHAEGLWTPDGIELPKLKVPSLRDVFEHVKGELRGMGFDKVGLSNEAEAEVLDSIFGDHASINLYGPNVFLALTTVAVTDTDTGSTITEANYTGYARKKIEPADMSAASAGSKTNSNALTFAACTAGSSTVIGWAVCSALTVGKVIIYGTCTSTVISTTQTPASVAASILVATAD